MKKAPLKILLIMIVTGVICVVGELILSRQLDKMQEIHQRIMDDSVKNRELMSKVNIYLYEHQAVLANYALADSADLQADYKDQEENLRIDIASLILDFSEHMKGGTREKLFHKVYTNIAGYEENTELLLKFIENGERDMASYYNNNVLKGFLDNINSRLADLDKYIAAEIEYSEEKVIDTVNMSKILRVAVIFIVMVFLLICIYISFKITSNLDKYKENLEAELIEKNRALQEHNEKMLKLQDDVIFGMANLIESRDGETGEHVKRTSAYATMIAKAAREQGVYADVLTDEYIERLGKVAPLHDVGKIAVPDSVLMKPGRLTEEEFEQIKIHATKGKQIIEEFFENIEDKEYVEMAGDVAGYHHEKWSGEGYAAKLTGDDIPLAARIMALADVFDALISKRRYKEAYSYDKAFSIIEESAGTHFDPKLAKVFISIRKQIEEFNALP